MPVNTNSRNYRPDDVTQMTFDENFSSRVMVSKDLLLVQKMSAGVNGMTEYLGFRAVGSDPALSVWFIKKIIYDGNNFITDVQIANDELKFNKKWADRATYTYQ